MTELRGRAARPDERQRVRRSTAARAGTQDRKRKLSWGPSGEVSRLARRAPAYPDAP